MKNKLLQFIIKHNLKITLIGVFFPILLQLKSCIAPPIIALYDKVPSLSQTYDSILSIRNPFNKKEKSAHHQVIENVMYSYDDKNLSREELTNIKFAIKELLELKDSDDELIKNAITGIEQFDFTIAKSVFHKQHILSQNPKDKAKYLGLNAILESFTDPKEAVALYNNALIFDPVNLFILNNIGQLYLKAKNYANAEKIYSNIIKIGKQNKKKPAIASLGYSNLGVISLAKTHYSEALQYFNKALKINKKYQLNLSMATQYTNIAVTYEKLKNIEDACYNYRQARIIFHRHYQDQQAEKISERLKNMECI